MTPTCEFCGSTNIQYWEKKKSWFNVHKIEEGKINIGKENEEDIYDSGFMCTDCLEEQPGFDEFEKNFLI